MGGPGFEIDALQAIKKGDGWSVQAFDTSLNSGGTDSCDVLIEFTEIPGDCYIGLIGNNFTNFNVDPKTSSHAIVCHFAGIDKPGQFYHKSEGTGSVIRLRASRLCSSCSAHRVRRPSWMTRRQTRRSRMRRRWPPAIPMLPRR